MVIKSPHNHASAFSSNGQQYRPTIPVAAYTAGQTSGNQLETSLPVVATTTEDAKIDVAKKLATSMATRYEPADVSASVDAMLSVNLATAEEVQSQIDLLFSSLLKTPGFGSVSARAEGSIIYEGIEVIPGVCAVSGDNQITLPVSLSITTYPNPVTVTNEVTCTITSIALEVLEFRWRDNSSDNQDWSKPNDYSFPTSGGRNYELAVRVRIPANTPYSGTPVWQLQYIISSDSSLSPDLKPGIWTWVAYISDVIMEGESWDPPFLTALSPVRFVTNPGPGKPGLLEGIYADASIQAVGTETGNDYRFYETEIRYLIQLPGSATGNYVYFRLHPTDSTSAWKFRMVSYTGLLNTPWAGPVG